MGSFAGPEIVTDGLVFAYDMGNTDKSWRGRPATNFFTNGHFSGGTGITQESGSAPTNEIILFRNPGNSEYVLRQTGTQGDTEYQINLTTQLAAATTYVMSGWYAESSNYSSADGSRMFHSRAFSTSGAHIALGIGIGTVLETRIVNGITWRYCYATITTPADYSNSFNWYVGYGSSSYTGHRYYTDLQMEVGTLPSRFINGTRSNTQSLLDFTRRNTITMTSPTYNSNGLFSFSGGTERITLPATIGPINNHFTMSAWINSTSISSTQNILSMNGPYFMRIDGSRVRFNVLTDSWLFQAGTTTLLSNTWYFLTMVWNGTAGTWTGYINGTQEFSTAKSGSVSATNFYGYVGYTPEGGEQSNFQGQIATVYYYNRALTAAEVIQNFNAKRGRYGI
jgi:hypothetical protein